MVDAMTRPRGTLRWTAAVAGSVLLIDGITFFFFGMLHAGVHMLGTLEPTIIAAAIVESVCCVLTIGAGVAVFMRRASAWRAAVWAQGLSAAGVVLGIVSQLRSGGGTPLNFVYHRVILSVLLIGLLYLLIPWVRRSL
jgi:hypothetical protein